MKDLTVVSIQDGILLGLRFRYDDKPRIIGVVGSEALDEADVTVVQGFSKSDVLIEVPSEDSLADAEILREQWHSEQKGAFLLHQIRPNLRCNMVSPLAALAALQRNAGDGISYLSKQREIFLNQGSIELLPTNTNERRSGYLCGPDAGHAAHATHATATHNRLLTWDTMRVEPENALRSELRRELGGLGHLFALTVGAALHLVNTGAPHTLNNS